MHAYARLQNFRRAVEEGKEVLDRRAGREPATQHAAWDALDESDERNQVPIPATSCAARRCRTLSFRAFWPGEALSCR